MMSSTALDTRLPRTSSWPARLPFYYGWVNVVVAAVAMSATLPGRTYGLGLIKEPLRAELGISDLQFNTLNFWAIVLGAVLVLPVGRLIDRIGTRTALVTVAGALGGCVLLMSRAWDETSLFITLTLVRGLGQGALSVVSIALVGKWFEHRAGPAMGVFTVLLAFGFLGPIFAVGTAVQQAGWRTAWAWVGYALLLGLVPFGWLLARSSPEACGLQPDEPEQAAAPSVPLAGALRTPAFWVYTLAATLFNLVFSALTLDNEALLVEHGLDGRQANDLILGVLMVSGLPANIIAGWLARRRGDARARARRVPGRPQRRHGGRLRRLARRQRRRHHGDLLRRLWAHLWPVASGGDPGGGAGAVGAGVRGRAAGAGGLSRVRRGDAAVLLRLRGAGGGTGRPGLDCAAGRMKDEG